MEIQHMELLPTTLGIVILFDLLREQQVLDQQPSQVVVVMIYLLLSSHLQESTSERQEVVEQIMKAHIEWLLIVLEIVMSQDISYEQQVLDQQPSQVVVVVTICSLPSFRLQEPIFEQ